MSSVPQAVSGELMPVPFEGLRERRKGQRGRDNVFPETQVSGEVTPAPFGGLCERIYDRGTPRTQVSCTR